MKTTSDVLLGSLLDSPIMPLRLVFDPSTLNIGRSPITARWLMDLRAISDGFPAYTVGPHPQSSDVVLLERIAVVLETFVFIDLGGVKKVFVRGVKQLDWRG
mmetsp:Transcript_20276/g.30149  ORF Transcript_20276/g.30149 Transcript_20276/m.30149 type:complete len:102 (-) Transcript_20276:89-394(-)